MRNKVKRHRGKRDSDIETETEVENEKNSKGQFRIIWNVKWYFTEPESSCLNIKELKVKDFRKVFEHCLWETLH